MPAPSPALRSVQSRIEPHSRILRAARKLRPGALPHWRRSPLWLQSRCRSLASSACDDAAGHEDADCCGEERDDRQRCADYTNDGQHEPDDADQPRDEAYDRELVQPSLPNPPRRVTPALLKIAHASRIPRAMRQSDGRGYVACA